MNIDVLLLMLFILTAYSVGSMIGFGSAVIAMTFGVLVFPIEFLIPVIVPLNIALCAYLVIRHRAWVNVGLLVKRILPFTILGMPIGLIIFHVAKADSLKWAFGVFVLGLSSLELYRVLRQKDQINMRPITPAKSAIWLTGGGILQGLWVSGGPVIAYWAGRAIPDKEEFRSTLSALWLILNLILLGSHIAAGSFNKETILMTVYTFPLMSVGVVVGEWLHPKLSQRRFRIVVYSVLIFAGVSIILRQL